VRVNKKISLDQPSCEVYFAAYVHAQREVKSRQNNQALFRQSSE